MDALEVCEVSDTYTCRKCDRLAVRGFACDCELAPHPVGDFDDKRRSVYNAIADQRPDWVEKEAKERKAEQIIEQIARAQAGILGLKPTGLPTDAKERKAIPIYSGCIRYFPDALAAVAELSRIGNDQHNPGKPLHWSRGKSTDHADTILRHLVDRGTFDSDGLRHSAKAAWRALALLQEELEADGAEPGRGSVFPYQNQPHDATLSATIGRRSKPHHLKPSYESFPVTKR